MQTVPLPPGFTPPQLTSRRRSVDLAILKLCERQHGVASIRQLVSMGIHKDAIYRRISSLHLHVVHPGVVALGHTVLSQHRRCMAASLACGATGVVTHRAAAWLHGTSRTLPRDIDITVSGNHRPIPGIRLHRSPSIDVDCIGRIEGVPTSSFARTVVDLGECMAFPLLAHVLYQRSFLGIYDEDEVRRELDRIGAKRGSRSVHAAMKLRRMNSAGSRSLSEARVHELLLEIGAPPVLITPDVQTPRRVLEPDFCWPRLHLCIEVDGEQHATPEGRAEDQRRDADLREAGYRVLRIPTHDVWRRPEHVRHTLRVTLEASGARMRKARPVAHLTHESRRS